jgi:hypothetical protein
MMPTPIVTSLPATRTNPLGWREHFCRDKALPPYMVMHWSMQCREPFTEEVAFARVVEGCVRALPAVGGNDPGCGAGEAVNLRISASSVSW